MTTQRPHNKRLEAKYKQEINRKNKAEWLRRERFVKTTQTKVQKKIDATK